MLVEKLRAGVQDEVGVDVERACGRNHFGRVVLIAYELTARRVGDQTR
jgi:hypothetical protein